MVRSTLGGKHADSVMAASTARAADATARVVGPRHHCPGSHLARAQIAVAVERLLDRLPGLALTDPDGSRPAGTVLRGPLRLPVTWG